MTERPQMDGLLDGADPIHHVLRAACWSLAERAEQLDQWDRPPELFVLVRTDGARFREIYGEHINDPKLADMMDQPEAMAVGCVPVPVPEPLWAAAEAHEILAMLPQVLHGMTPPQGEPFAIILVNEAWAVEHRPGTPMPEPGTLDTHPDRIEMRMVVAVDLTGAHVIVRHNRGGHIEESDDGVPGGRMLAQLEEILQAMTDVEPPH
jgi:hypothetical protein